MIKISFKSHTDAIRAQINYIMRENYASIEQDVVKNCTTQIEEKFKPFFNNKLETSKNNISQNDLRNLLLTIKNAYKNSGLEQDAKIIETQIQKLNMDA